MRLIHSCCIVCSILLLATCASTPEKAASAPEQLILRISDPEPGMPLGTMALNDQVVSMEMLPGYFQRATPKQKEMLIIQSGRDVSHEQIVRVLDLAKRADVKKIGFAVVAE